MYRIAKAADQTRERRRQATHPAKVKPELLADGPSQVWTWDITKLRGPAKGVWYHLYVIIDIFSRYNPSWLLSTTESAEEAEEFIEEAVNRNGAVPHTVHADRGTSMTSGSVSELLANLGIDRSHSRPRTSNDNPFSEAQFKTLKYVHDFPKSFASLGDAHIYLDGFFNEYNHVDAIPASAGTPRHRSTSAPPMPSTKPAKPPLPPPTTPTPPGSVADPPHRRGRRSPTSTNPHPNPNRKSTDQHCLI
ncbi:MAG: DDE-type integrase/transposase/recombinase [Mycobacterium sp.]